jgi:hypothetical protein
VPTGENIYAEEIPAGQAFQGTINGVSGLFVKSAGTLGRVFNLSNTKLVRTKNDFVDNYIPVTLTVVVT